jgi:hypothetical protein
MTIHRARQRHSWRARVRTSKGATEGDDTGIFGALTTLEDHVVIPAKLLPLPSGSGPDADLTSLIEALNEQSGRCRRDFVYAQGIMAFFVQSCVHMLAPSPARAMRPLPRAPSAIGPQLLLFVACHCSSTERLRKLQRTVRSVLAQRAGSLTRVLVSWSAANEPLRAAVRLALQLLAADSAGLLLAFERPSSPSQFEHLASLLPEARRLVGGADGSTDAHGHPIEAWVMFTDDDDLLHPSRCAAYLSAIRAAPEEAHAVSAAWVARPVEDERQVHSAADVDALIASGRVLRTPKEGSEKEGGGGGWDEYWNVAVRLNTLQRFFDEACPPSARACKYADIGLYYYLKHSVPTMRFEPHAAGFTRHWCHYYDKPLRAGGAARGEEGAASSGTTLVEGDEERAIAAERVLRETANASEGLPNGGAVLAATLRDFLRQNESHTSGTQGLRPPQPPPQGQHPTRPALLVMAQMRSICELFCASFIGAPNLPSDKQLLQLASPIVIDQLAAIGVNLRVASVLGQLLLEPLLREVIERFGLPRGFSLRPRPPQIAATS